MPDDTIQASVGMHNNGATPCYNLPGDVASITRLLNCTDISEGGKSGSGSQLPPGASARALYQAILDFQRFQNNLGRTPRLSVDGHVDPNGMTLARLNRTARKLHPIGPNDGPVFPPDLPFPPATPAPASVNFRIALLSGLAASKAARLIKLAKLKASAGFAVDILAFYVWDTTNNLAAIYVYVGGGIGVGLTLLPKISSTTHGPWNDFSTAAACSSDAFGGPARFTTAGVGPWSLNWINLIPKDVYLGMNTGITIGAGASSTVGVMDVIDGPAPFSGP